MATEEAEPTLPIRPALGITRVIDRLGERRLVVILLLIAALMRFGAAFHYLHLKPQRVENQMIAVALVQNQGYADAFRPDSGPTAHSGPLAPLVMAGVYKMFGVETPLAEAVLTLLGIGSVILTFYLLYRCFEQLGVARAPRLAALAFVCLVPIQLSLESTELGIWEVGYGTAAMSAILLAVLRLDARRSVGLPALCALAGATAVLEVFSPSTGLAAAGLLGLLLVRRTRWPIWFLIGGLTLAFFIAITTPWKLRNERVLGEPVRTRSSFGLSFAIGYYEGQLINPSPRGANVERLEALHPHYRPGPGYERMKAAGGEVAYNRQLVAETRRWIASHPSDALKIALRNLWNFYCPPAWFWDRWSDAQIRPVSIVRAILFDALSLAGLATLAWLLLRRRWLFLYLGVAILLPAIPYVMTFPLLRYRYPISSVLIFLAFAGAMMLAARRLSERQPTGRAVETIA